MKKIILLLAVAVISLRAWGYETVTSDKLRVWAEFPDTIVADGQTVNYITVYQHDDDDLDYSAFNMEFILPEGFTVNKVKEGRSEVNDIHLSDRADATHSISCNIVDGVDLRIIAYSSQSADLYKDDLNGEPLDELFTVGLIASPSLETGDYEVENKGILFVHNSGDAKIPACDPTFYTVHVEGSGSSAIRQIEADELADDNCYDLLGRRIDPSDAHGMIVVCKGRKYLVR